MNASVIDPFKKTTSGCANNRPGAEHLHIGGRVQLILDSLAKTFIDLSADTVLVRRENKIRLLAIYDGFDFGLKDIPLHQSKFCSSHVALMDNFHGVLGFLYTTCKIVNFLFSRATNICFSQIFSAL